MKMTTWFRSPLKDQENPVTAPVIDKRAIRKQVEASESRENAKTATELEHVRRMNEIEARRAALELEEFETNVKLRKKETTKRAKRQNRDETVQRLKERAPGWIRTALVTGPIVSPMAVAWTSQTAFANQTLHWPGPAGVVFAAAWEASTAFCGWMYHEARKDGDRGTPYKVATWSFALGAGVMNYWHNMPSNHIMGDPTAKAVSYGVMSITGIALWELYTRLMHRKHLRKKGVLNEARPSFGLLRWIRFPKTTFHAWSATIKSQKTMTIDEAWKTAQDETDRRPEYKVTVARETKTSVMTLPKARVRLAWTHPKTVQKTIAGGQDQPVLTERSRRVPQLETHKTEPVATKTTAQSNTVARPKTTRIEPTKTTSIKTDDEVKTGIVVKTKPTDEDRDNAIRLYIEAVKNGETMTKAALAEKTGFSLSWSYTQILAARKILAAETKD
jgi:hypothetical protein